MSQRILVVDDDREIVRLVRAYLEQAGFAVYVAYNGETALHAVRRERPDLIVLDLMLPRVLRVRELTIDLDRHKASVADQSVDLTATEFEFLRALMEYPNHAFTRLELIERALGYEYEGLERTVDSHIKNLRRKIEPNPKKPTYIETVYGVGYRLQGET